MEKHIYSEQTGISYTLHGDYYLPDLTLSFAPLHHIKRPLFCIFIAVPGEIAPPAQV